MQQPMVPGANEAEYSRVMTLPFNAGDHSRVTARGWLCSAVLALGMGLSPVHAAEPASKSYLIVAQPLASALKSFAAQSDMQLIFSEADVRNAETAGVNGSLSPREALAEILKGTDLEFEFTANNVIVVRRIGSPRASVPASVQATGIVATEANQAVVTDTLYEVIVTAQKRSESAKDVPASVSVLSGESLERLQVKQLTDYAGYVPGFNVSPGGSPGQVTLSLRGLSPLSDTSTVGTYIDDAPLGSSGSWARATGLALDLLPYDLERIEILRGPQGTLYGANTLGGLLKYVIRSPDLNEFQGRVGADLSSVAHSADLGWGAQATVNVPLADGKVALRGSYARKQTPGFVDGAVDGVKDENEAAQEGGRLALLWQASERLSIKLSSLFQQIDSKNDAVVSLDPTTLATQRGDLTSVHALPQPFHQKLQFYAATVNWALDWADFSSTSSYMHMTNERDIDMSDTFGPIMPFFCAMTPACASANGPIGPGLAAFLVDLKFDKYTQELRLASHSDTALEWLAGLFYTYEDSANHQAVSALDQTARPITGIDPLLAGSVPTTYEEYAAFGDVTYKFSDAFDLTAGVRLARNQQQFRQITYGPAVGTGDVRGESAENVITYLLSPRYRPSEDVMVYGRIASGYRPGGPNLAAPGVPPQVDADTLVSYEVGVKSQMHGGRALLDLAVFYIDWKDIQLTASNGQIGWFENGGKAKSQGVELSGAFFPVEGLRLGLATAYTDATLAADALSLGGRKGDALPEVPEWSGSITIDYEKALGDRWTARFGGGYRYVGERYSEVASSPNAIHEEAYDIIDLSAGLATDGWIVTLFAKNLLDERAYPTAAMVNDVFGAPIRANATVVQPRTIGLSLDVRF